jgi:hypothetical protein
MGKTELQKPLGRVGLNGRIKLRLILNGMGVCELGSLAQWLRAGISGVFCEDGRREMR